jgi:Domain of unknown function DUF29
MTLVKSSLYSTDYAGWVEQTVELLRQGRLNEVDLEVLIEEVEDLGKSQRQALKSNLRVLLMHLLKWQYQPERQSNSWRSTIREHRNRILDILEDSPSLRNVLAESLDQCYRQARLQAADETDLEIKVFPEQCPYVNAQILNEDFLP